jgi:hypothetical protein
MPWIWGGKSGGLQFWLQTPASWGVKKRRAIDIMRSRLPKEEQSETLSAYFTPDASPLRHSRWKRVGWNGEGPGNSLRIDAHISGESNRKADESWAVRKIEADLAQVWDPLSTFEIMALWAHI